MSWRDRAIPVDQAQAAPQASDWRSRAIPVKLPADETPSTMSDLFSKVQEGALMGAKPFVAGVAGGLGSLSGGGSFSEGYKGARDEARKEEEVISKRSPIASTVGNLGGAVLTAPLFAAKGLQAAIAAKDAGLVARLAAGLGQSAKMGAAIGGAEALGHADTAGQAVESIGKGAALGAGLQLGGNAIGMAVPAAIKGIKGAMPKIASTVSGIPEQEIKTLAGRADDVMSLMKKAGGDVSLAADQVRSATMKDVQVARQKLNLQISDALTAPQYQGASVNASPVMAELQKALDKSSKITAAYKPGELNELKNVIDTTKKFIGSDGKIGIQDLHEIKQQLQDIASSSYMNGAVIFPKGEIAARAAKGAAAEAKRLLDVAVPEVARANQQLSRLHAIESQMNKNLIKAGKPEAALLAAGSGSNERSARLLSSLDKITGGNALEQAQNLAAGRRFYDVPILPIDATGKSLSRMALGAGTGTLLGGPMGAAIGTALTSPGAVKYGTLGVNALGKMIPSMGLGPTGRSALMNDVLQEVSAAERHAETATERRLRELQNRVKTRSTKTKE